MTATAIPATARSISLGASIASATSLDEALIASGLNWGLNLVPANNLSVFTEDGAFLTQIPGQRLVMRDDTHVTLGVVGGRYHAVPNTAAFAVADHLYDQGARFTEAGELDHGRTTFVRMSLPGCDVALADGKDLIKAGITLRAVHDGTGKVTASLDLTRLICTNGMVAKIKGIPHTFAISHTASADRHLANAHTIMNGAIRYAKGFAAAASHMLDTPMSKDEFGQFIDSLFPMPEVKEGESPRGMTMWENRRGALMELFTFAETNELGRGTAMGAYNALTEWIDWGKHVRSSDGASDEGVLRARRRIEGADQSLKDAALAALV